MLYVDVEEAKKTIDVLLEKVISDQEGIIFTQDGQPVEKLEPCTDERIPDVEK